MLNLIINEWHKSFLRRNNYTSLLILAVIALAVGLMPLLGDTSSDKSYKVENLNDKVSESIKGLSEENKNITKESNYNFNFFCRCFPIHQIGNKKTNSE